MLQVTEKLLQEMTDLIVREVKPRQIILFGSHARGTARADSDLDFLVVEDGPFDAQRSRRAEMTRLRSILCDYFIPMDFLVFTQQEIEEWKNVRNHVVFHALQDGRTLYESH
ncbi:MAG: nucleotidyltransferase domain-containing protein [Geobacteraceae bacterium]